MDGCWVASNDEGTNGINQAKGLFLLLNQINKTELTISCPPYSYVSYLAMDRSTSRESGDLQLTDRSRSSLYLCVDPAPLPLLPDFSHLYFLTETYRSTVSSKRDSAVPDLDAMRCAAARVDLI